MWDTDGDREIEMDVAAKVDRMIDRTVEQDELDENSKKIVTSIAEKNERPNKFRSG